MLVFAYEVTDQTRARQRTEALQAELLAAAQRQVQARETFYQVFEETPALICILRGPEHRYEYLNSAYQRHFPGRQLTGRPVAEALPETVEQGFIALLDGVYHTGQTYFGQELLLTIEATATAPAQADYYNLTYQAYREQGQIVGVCVFAYVVTEQVLARQQVEQLNQELEARVQERTRQVDAAQAATEHERAQLQAVLAQAPVAIALFAGEDLRVTSVNAAISTLWGYPPEHVVGRPLLEAVPELQGQGFDDLLRQVLHTRVPFIGTETPALLQRAGQLHTTYFNFVYQPLYEADGQVTSVLCLAVDVTEQVLARQQVEQLNQVLEARVQARTRELQTLFAQAPMALVVLRGPQFLIEQANAQAGHIWGVAVADVLGRPHFEAIPGSGGQGFEQLLTGVLATGEAVVLREVLIKLARAHTGQPSEGYYNVIFKPLFNEGQPQATGIVVMWTETTDQVLARQQVQDLNEELAAINEELAAINEELTVTNEELHESNQQLTRTNVDLDNFIYTASHDLKAPITNIEGLLLALEHELPAAARPGDVPLMLTLMQEAVERFRRTINHLTDLSRLQKEHNPDADAVVLAPVVEAVRLDLSPLLTHTQGQLTVTIPKGLTVTFAEKNLRSVVYNLLSNAFKYHHPDRLPAVQLRGSLTDDYAVLEVQDNGLGLDLAQGQEKLFAMFQRLHTHVEGTGVGLYMVKRILENAGGRIEVDSQLGQGSTFRVYFPR
ncbi:PAS domain-containing sensor histidine kinase [Hymenobacter sp. GOD-10R]|uniref:PAS domain-containing sensor histidine kinase n=1 Tax=Hymenobacter sp. GOD-10R TaxID=3093922 RepID=UPI002D784483|nr:PAS domain-containing protein [Hymenobacter sp. GOD-10R]WRQ31784.1 PAS domain-containing protein [Hymenobacter sp. GOD-10R]